MLRSLNHLQGYAMRARDNDEIGQVDDFLFDDLSWVIRYLVLDTGNWLVGRKVLVLPAALDTPDWEAKALTATLSRQQIEDSPPLAADQPVSRRKELELRQYYGMAPYWGLGSAPFPVTLEQTSFAQAASAKKDRPAGDPNLRSAREVTGYHIQARDGDIGHVEDFIVDDEDWIIRYLVVDTRNWLPGGKQVLLAPAWVEEIAWSLRKVHVDLARDTIKDSPEFDPTLPVNREYEIRLYDYYGWPQYWTRL